MSSNDTLYTASVFLTATTFVSGISWGFMTSLYLVSMCSLVRSLRSTQPTSKTALLIAWTTILWILSSLFTMAAAYCTLYEYSWKLDYPGGPAAYLRWNMPLPTLAYSAYLLSMWFADAMMIWRLVVFYHGVHRLTRSLVLSFVFLIYVTTIVLGCVMLAINSSDQPLYSALAVKVAIPCFILSVILNVFITALISIRLLLFSRQTKRILGRKETQASPYTYIATMLIESSALYATCSLAFIAVYAVGNPGQYVMSVLLCNVQVISPLLIVYRVSEGMSWEETSTELTFPQIAFSEPEDHGRSDITLEVRNVGLDSGYLPTRHASLVENEGSCSKR